MNGILLERLGDPSSKSEEELRLCFREAVQEIALYSLSAHGFFEKAIFHGGTELRIVHSLPRFSEDLDFLLRTPDDSFDWADHEEELFSTCRRFGLSPEIRRKPRKRGAIRAMLLIDDSNIVGSVSGRSSKTRIRLEIDTKPPSGTDARPAFLDFPAPHEITAADLPSSLALKCHALLCRSWVKGRDWFDLLWFCSRDVRPNYPLLSSALDQAGPWKGKGVVVTPAWLEERLKRRLAEIDLRDATLDVLPFVRGEEKAAVEGWSEAMFLHYIGRLSGAED